MSLRDGTKKMSKSDPSDLSRINLRDTADEISKKIRKAKTDPEPLPGDIEGLADRAEAANLVGIYAALSGRTKDEVLSDFGGQPFSVFKPALADLAVEQLAPMADEMNRLMAEPGPYPCRLARRRRTGQRHRRTDPARCAPHLRLPGVPLNGWPFSTIASDTQGPRRISGAALASCGCGGLIFSGTKTEQSRERKPVSMITNRILLDDPLSDGRQSDAAARVWRGTARMLRAAGFACVGGR